MLAQFRALAGSVMRRGFGLEPFERWMDSWGNGYPTASGYEVSELTALQLPAVWACVDLISKAGSVLPGNVFRRLPEGGIRDREKTPWHYLQPIIHDYANPSLSAMEWRKIAICHYLLWGNHYSWIEWAANNRVKALWPISPSSMRTERKNLTSRIRYFVTDVNGQEHEFQDWEILHVRNMSLDGHRGLSPIGMCREAIALAGANQQSAANMHRSGFTSRLILTYPGALDDEQTKKLRESFEAANSGLQNQHKAIVLQNGITAAPFSINPDDAQFLGQTDHSDHKIYQIFGVPPHMVGDTTKATSFGSGIEQMSIGFVTYTLLPIANLFETTIEHQLLPDGNPGDNFIEYELKGLLRGDTAARAAWHRAMVELGVYSPNRVLHYENEDPYEGGDVFRRPLNTAFVDSTGKVVMMTLPPGDTPAEPGADPPVPQEAPNE